MFKIMDRDFVVSQFVEMHPTYKSWILIRNVQSGKTSDCLDLAGCFFKTSLIISIGANNTGLQEQTNIRSKVKGFTVTGYMDKINLPMYFLKSVGKKMVLSFLMEPHHLNKLLDVLTVMDDVPITLIIDEADQSRNTVLGTVKNKSKNNDNSDNTDADTDTDTDEEVIDSNTMPPVTRMLLQLKNLVKNRENSRTIFVTATPMGVLAAEKDKWAVMYKEPYQNYVGVGLNHPINIHISNTVIAENHCPAKQRWLGGYEDITQNTFGAPLDTAVCNFISLTTKDSSIKQIMLVSLEKLKRSQKAMASFCKDTLSRENCSSIDVIIVNGDTKEDGGLAAKIRKSSKNKIIIIAGFMASRGVSYTDFSDPTNQFECVCQLHYTFPQDKLNTSLQSMRLFGPCRRTVAKPSIITNRLGIQDLQHNFLESYRIISDIANQCENDQINIESGNYNVSRKMTQDYNWRWLKQGWVGKRFIYSSTDPDDALPID